CTGCTDLGLYLASPRTCASAFDAPHFFRNPILCAPPHEVDEHMKTPFYTALFVALFLPLTGCKRQPLEGAQEIHRPYIGPELTANNATPGPDEAARRACEARMREVLKQPEVPGAPAIESQRATLLARTKAEPVLFKERPEYGPEPVPLV